MHAPRAVVEFLQQDKWFGSRSTNFGGPPSPPFRRAILGSIGPPQPRRGS
jgi:hypothetical protein